MVDLRVGLVLGFVCTGVCTRVGGVDLRVGFCTRVGGVDLS